MQSLWIAALIGWLGAVVLPAAQAASIAKGVVDRLLAPPTIQTEPGFAAKVLIPPGQLYDPLVMRPMGDFGIMSKRSVPPFLIPVLALGT